MEPRKASVVAHVTYIVGLQVCPRKSRISEVHHTIFGHPRNEPPRLMLWATTYRNEPPRSNILWATMRDFGHPHSHIMHVQANCVGLPCLGALSVHVECYGQPCTYIVSVHLRPNAATLGRPRSMVAHPCLRLVGVRHGYLGNHHAYFVGVQEWLVDFHVKRSERPHTQRWASRRTLWATMTCCSGRASYILRGHPDTSIVTAQERVWKVTHSLWATMCHAWS